MKLNIDCLRQNMADDDGQYKSDYLQSLLHVNQ
jgi:hypothetical protein